MCNMGVEMDNDVDDVDDVERVMFWCGNGLCNTQYKNLHIAFVTARVCYCSESVIQNENVSHTQFALPRSAIQKCRIDMNQTAKKSILRQTL